MKTPRWNRIGAFVIDITTANAFSSLIMIFIGKYFIVEGTNILADMFTVISLLILSVIFMICYNVLCYELIGGTFGKLVLRVEIVDSDPTTITYKQLIGIINGKDKVDIGTMISREYLKWVSFYATLGIYGVYCFYKIMKKETLMHEKKSKTKIRSLNE